MNGHLSAIGDVAVRMPPPHISRLLFLFLFLGNLWEGLAKSISDQGALGELFVEIRQDSSFKGEVCGGELAATANALAVIIICVPCQ